MTPESLRDQTEELWRETLREALLEWEPKKLKRILETGVGLQIISRKRASKIIAALGVG